MNAGAIIIGKTNLSVCFSLFHLLRGRPAHTIAQELSFFKYVLPYLPTQIERITFPDSEDLRSTVGGLQWGAKVNPRTYAEAFALTTAFLGTA